jgi:hypothetical protein
MGLVIGFLRRSTHAMLPQMRAFWPSPRSWGTENVSGEGGAVEEGESEKASAVVGRNKYCEENSD